MAEYLFDSTGLGRQRQLQTPRCAGPFWAVAFGGAVRMCRTMSRAGWMGYSEFRTCGWFNCRDAQHLQRPWHPCSRFIRPYRHLHSVGIAMSGGRRACPLLAYSPVSAAVSARSLGGVRRAVSSAVRHGSAPSRSRMRRSMRQGLVRTAVSAIRR